MLDCFFLLKMISIQTFYENEYNWKIDSIYKSYINVLNYLFDRFFFHKIGFSPSLKTFTYSNTIQNIINLKF